MKQLKFSLLLITISCISLSGLLAQTSLPSILSDNMCLQQLTEVKIWGWDNPGQGITVDPSWSDAVTTETNNTGSWLVTIKTPQAGGNHEISVSGSSQQTIRNVLIGEVWLCSGQSNMDRQLGLQAWQKPIINFKEASEKANYPEMRLFRVNNNTAETPLSDLDGKWVSCSPETALEFSAVGFFFGKALHESLSVPVGLIHSAWGGTRVEAWTKKEDLDKELLDHVSWLEGNYPLDSSYYYRALDHFNSGLIDVRPTIPESVRERNLGPNRLSVLYNAMIAPLTNFAIRGAIWYQGESNRETWKEYKYRFPGMIESWRNLWDMGDFPFYFVQIAPYNYIEEFAQPQIVEAQVEALKLPNTGIAATQDIATFYDIHPPQKEEVGRRLSLIALNQTYGKKDIVYSGPVVKDHLNNGDTYEIHFEASGGELFSASPSIGGVWAFHIAGEDKVFYKATVKQEGDKVILSSPSVKQPVAARYNWSNNANATLFNSYGLPALPFRTDRWDEAFYGE